MKLFSDKGKPMVRPGFMEEFSNDFGEIEHAYAQKELAGGAISRRVDKARIEAGSQDGIPYE